MKISAPETEYFEFTVGNRKKTYKIPLAMYMPMADLRMIAHATRIQDDDEQAMALIDIECELLSKYMGKDADELTGSQVAEIFNLWQKAGSEDVTSGE